MTEIIKNPTDFPGCDVVLRLGEEFTSDKIRILQITDMQFIDANQRRTPDRLRPDEISAWQPESFDALCGDQIRSLVAQTRPSLIFITGDIVYGSFDDSGRGFEWFCDFMESLEIPWAPVFGNHDNESSYGVDRQCRLFESLPHCLFVRGRVTGNGNYTLGIAANGKLVRVMHLLDSHGCLRKAGIYPDQIELIRENSRRIRERTGKAVPTFVAHHIPTAEFLNAEISKGYVKADGEHYTLGVDVKPESGDFGSKLERMNPMSCPEYLPTLREIGADGVFVGHCHAINTCIHRDGIAWVFGLKTGQYDYHVPGQLGGTLITLEGCELEKFEVTHIPALTKLSPYPGKAKMFEKFFAEE